MTDEMCKHDDHKKFDYLPVFDRGVVYMCKCGALIDITAAENPISATELTDAINDLLDREAMRYKRQDEQYILGENTYRE